MSGTSKPGTLAPGSSVISELRVQGLLELITAMLVEVLPLILVDSDKSDNKLVDYLIPNLLEQNKTFSAETPLVLNRYFK